MRPDAEAACVRALDAAQVDGLALIRGLYNPNDTRCCLIGALARPAVAAGSSHHDFVAEARARLNATLPEVVGLEAGWEGWDPAEPGAPPACLAAYGLGAALAAKYQPSHVEAERRTFRFRPSAAVQA